MPLDIERLKAARKPKVPIAEGAKFDAHGRYLTSVDVENPITAKTVAKVIPRLNIESLKAAKGKPPVIHPIEQDLQQVDSLNTTQYITQDGMKKMYNPSLSPIAPIPESVYSPTFPVKTSNLSTSYATANKLLLEANTENNFDKLEQAKDIIGSDIFKMSNKKMILPQETIGRITENHNNLLKNIEATRIKIAKNKLESETGINFDNNVVPSGELFMKNKGGANLVTDISKLGVIARGSIRGDDLYNKGQYDVAMKNTTPTSSEYFKNVMAGLPIYLSSYDDKLNSLQKQKQESFNTYSKSMEELNKTAPKDGKFKTQQELDSYNDNAEAIRQDLVKRNQAIKRQDASLRAEAKLVPDKVLNSTPELKEQYDQYKRINNPDTYNDFNWVSKTAYAAASGVANMVAPKQAWLIQQYSRIGGASKDEALYTSLEAKNDFSPPVFVTGYDRKGVPEYSNQSFTSKGINPYGLIESNVQVLADFYLINQFTNAAGKAVGALQSLNKAKRFEALMDFKAAGTISKINETEAIAGKAIRANLSAKVLASPISSRALTFLTASGSAYPQTYFSNIGKFKTTNEAVALSVAQSTIEGLTESIVPNVDFFKSSAVFPIFQRLSNIAPSARMAYLKNVVADKLPGRLGLSAKNWKAAQLALVNFFQEGVVEEQASFLANTQLDAYVKTKYKDYVPENVLNSENFFESLRDAASGMILTSIVGLPGNVVQAKQQYHYDFSKPQSLINYQWAIGSMPNVIRGDVNKSNMTAEQKVKAHTLIDHYRKAYESSIAKTQKPDSNTLEPDINNTYTHFGSSLMIQGLETKIQNMEIAPEHLKAELERYKSVTSKIEKENETWEKMDPQERETKWFSWFTRNHEEIPNLSSFATTLKESKEAIEKQKPLMLPHLFQKYQEAFQKLDKHEATKAVSTAQELSSVGSEHYFMNYKMMYRDLMAAKPHISTQEFNKIANHIGTQYEASKERTINETAKNFEKINDINALYAALPAEYRDSSEHLHKRFARAYIDAIAEGKNEDFYNLVNDAIAELPEEKQTPEELVEIIKAASTAPVVTAPIIPAIPSIITPEKKAVLEDLNTGTNQDKRDKVKAHFDSIAPENLHQEILDYVEINFPDKFIQFKKDLEEGNTDGAIATVPQIEDWILNKPFVEPPEPLLEGEQEEGSQTIPEDATSNLKTEYGIDARPVSGMITISDEFNGQQQRQQNDFVEKINKWLDDNKDVIADENRFTGELMPNTMLFERLEVDIALIQETLDKYWKDEISEYDALKTLNELFKGSISPNSVAWHLDKQTKEDKSPNKMGEVNELYGRVKDNRKFQDVTLRSFTLAVLNNEGNHVKQDGQPIVRSLPKVKQLPNGTFEFYSIVPLSTDDIQDSLRDLHNAQEIFLDKQKQSIPVTLDAISNGFNLLEADEIDIPNGEDLNLQDENRGQLKKGMVLDSKGERLWSRKLNPTDINVIAFLLGKDTRALALLAQHDGELIFANEKALNDYVYKLVHLTPEEKKYLATLTHDELKHESGPLAINKSPNKYGTPRNIPRRYNVVFQKLSDEIKHLSIDFKTLKPSEADSYKSFVTKKLFKYEIKKQIRAGNKKIYFSVKGSAIESASHQTTSAAILPPVLQEDWIIPGQINPLTKEPLTYGDVTKAIDNTLLDLQNLYEQSKGAVTPAITSLETSLETFEAWRDSAIAPPISPAKARIKTTPITPVVTPEVIAPLETKQEVLTVTPTAPVVEAPKPSVKPRTKGLDFPSSITDFVSLEDEQRAYNWFVKSFLSKGIDINLSFTQDPIAFARFTNTAITLFYGANYTMLYHEAWHRFTQHYLTREEKEKLYASVKSLFPDEFLGRDYKLYEEALAEAFRSYMKGDKFITLKVKGTSHTINIDKPKTEYKGITGFFKKIADFFKGIFNQNGVKITSEQLILQYLKEASKPKTLRKSDVSNTFFTSLNTERKKDFLTTTGEKVSFDYSAMYEMDQAIDYMFVDAFDRQSNMRQNAEEEWVEETPEQREARNFTENNISALLSASKKDKQEQAEDLYADVLQKLTDKRDSLKDVDKKLEFTAVIDNFYSYFVKNTSRFRESLVGKIQNDFTLALEDMKDDESRGLNSEYYENLSNYEHADEAVLNSVRLLPKMDKQGNLVNSDYWGLPQLDDFNKNWTILAKNLSGLTFPEMIEKITSLVPKYPQFKHLLKNINLDYKQGKLSPIMMRNKFVQVFNMANIPEMLTYLSNDETGDLVIKFIEAGTNLPKQLLRQWDGDFVSDYQEGPDKILNVTNLLDKYTEAFLGISVENNLEFLKAIGVEYTNPADILAMINSAKPSSKYSKFTTAVGRIHSELKALNLSGNIITFPLESIELGRKTEKKERTGEGKSLELIASIEADTNEVLSDDQMLRADGNTSWKYTQLSYLSTMVRDLNKLDYSSIRVIYPHLDVYKNPEIKNTGWFTSLFEYNKENSTYTKRRTDENFLEITKIGGLKAEDIDEGEVTINLEASDKLVMDFLSLINSGMEEAVRFADKSTAVALKMNVKDNYNVSDSSPTQYQTARIIQQIGKQIVGEIIGIKHIKSLDEAKLKNIKLYHNNYKEPKFIYGEFLSPDLKTRLLSADLLLHFDGSSKLSSASLQKDLEREISKYFDKKADDFKIKFDEAHGNKNIEYSKLFPSKFSKESALDVFKYYYSYSVMNRIEQFNFVYGSTRNYKNADDVFKRIAAYGAVGKYAVTDAPFLTWINSQDTYQRNLEKLYTGVHRDFDDKFSMVHFEDMRVMVQEFSPEELAKNTNYTPKEKKQLENYYKNGDVADASGNATLDFYRQFLISIGAFNTPQQNAYKLQLEFERAKIAFRAEGSTEKEEQAFIEARKRANASVTDLTSILNIKKLQYSGSIYSTHTIADNLDVRAFEKFSVAPLIPSVIYGTKWDAIAQNMYRTHTDMTNFGSGSKMNWDQPTQLFDTWASSSIIPLEKDALGFAPSVLSLASLKEQLPIDNIMKTQGIFASQMRKLLSVGLFENGSDITGREKALVSYYRYKQSVENITNLVKEELSEKFSSPKKLAKYIQDEFGKRDIPDHVLEFVQYYEQENRLANPLDFSFQSFQLQNVLFSIVNNKIIKQKFPGGQFIQAPNSGYVNATNKENTEYGQDDLEIYRADSKTGDGLPMDVKISFSSKYHGLLQISYKGKKIAVEETIDGETTINIDSSLAKLNILLKNKDFIKLHGRKFTLVGCRIPVQGFSTIESMRVKQFLPSIAGQIVILPAGITIKSGSDYDLDKMNIYEPIINSFGNIINTSDSSPIEDFRKNLKTIASNELRIANIKTRLSELDIIVAEEEEEMAVDAFAGLTGRFTNLEDLQAQLTAPKPTQKNSKGELEALKIELDELIANNKKVKRYQREIVPTQINNLIESVSEIILDRGNFETLVTKNEPDYLEAEYGLKTWEWEKGILKNALKFSDVVDPLVSNRVFEKNTVGKQALGMDAKANSFFALALEAGLKIVAPSPSVSYLPQNLIGKSLSLSTLYSQPSKTGDPKSKIEIEYFKPVYIPKFISDFISGHVDIAKDSRISEIRADQLRTPIYLYMAMSGTHPHDIRDFLTSKHILQLVEDYKRLDSIIYKSHVNNTAKRNQIRALGVDYKGEEWKATARKELAKNEMLWKTLNKYSKGAIENFYIYVDPKAEVKIIDRDATIRNIVKNESRFASRKEFLDIAQFMVLKQDNDKFTELTTAASWDTTTAKNFVEMNYPKIKLAKIKQDGWFNNSAIDEMQHSSVIAPLEPSEFVEKYYSDSFAIISKPAFIMNTIKLFDKTFGKSLETFSRDYQNDFLTYLFQNFALTPEGKSMYYSLIEQQKLLDKNNKDNIQKRWNNIISKIKDTSFLNNSFVNKLMFRKIKKSFTFSPELKNSNIDPHTANLLHYDLLKLLDPQFKDSELNAELHSVVKDLIDVTSLLNGVNKIFRGFQSLIPTDTFTNTMRDILASPQLQQQLNDTNSPLYVDFNSKFVLNRGKYFPNAKKKLFYSSTDRYNYFDIKVRFDMENHSLDNLSDKQLSLFNTETNEDILNSSEFIEYYISEIEKDDTILEEDALEHFIKCIKKK